MGKERFRIFSGPAGLASRHCPSQCAGYLLPFLFFFFPFSFSSFLPPWGLYGAEGAGFFSGVWVSDGHPFL